MTLTLEEDAIESQRLANHQCLVCGKKLPKSFRRPIHTMCTAKMLGTGEFARHPS